MKVQMNAVVHHLRRWADESGELRDADLVRQFVERGDEHSFATLIERHGPMVLRLCQRILWHRQDAEDVFQETFLLLARKAGSIRKPGSVASWLHGTAYRLAKKAGNRHTRQPISGVAIEKAVHISPEMEAAWRELRVVLDEEFARLPDKYRAVLVLCFLEGKTHEEAARQLGWPLGTVKCRIVRGRDLLRGRLARRGLTLSISGLTTLMAASTATAAVPPELFRSTLRHALSGAASSTDAANFACNPAEKVGGQTVLINNARVVAFILAICVMGLGVGALVRLPEPGRLSEKPATPMAQNVNSSKRDPAGKDALGDSLPTGALLRLGSARFRHKSEVTSVAFSHDGKRLFTAGGDSSLRIWDAATGKELASFADQKVHRASMVLSPNGKLLVVADDEQISFRAGISGKLLRTISNKTVVGGPVADGVPTTFSFDGRLLATGVFDHSIRIWNVKDGSIKLQLPRQKQLQSLAFSRDGKVVLAATGGHLLGATIRTWSTKTGREMRVIRLPKDQNLRPFAFSPDGKTLALVGFTKRDKIEVKVHLWDTTTGKERIQLKGQEASIWKIAFSADSRSVAWMGMDNRLVVADAATGRIRHRFQSWSGTGTYHTTLAFSRDGKMIAAVGRSAAAHVWDLTTGREILDSAGTHHNSVNDVAYAPDGRSVASASSDTTVRIWDSATGKPLRKLSGHKGPVSRLVYSADGRRIASASYENRICIWDAATGKLLRAIQAVNPEGNRGVTALVFTRDAKKLLSFGSDRRLCLWDVATGKAVFNRPVQLHHLPMLAEVEPKKIPPFNPHQRLDAEFSPDGALLALGTTENIFVVDTQTGLLHTHLKGQGGGGPLHMAFAPDNRTLAAGGGKVRLWELASAKEIFKVKVQYVNSVAFAAGGRMIAVADGYGWRGRGQIHLFDAATGAKLHSFKGHRTFVGGLAFSPNGKLLTSAQLDTTLLSWDLAPAHRNVKSQRQKLSGNDLDRLWTELAGKDVRQAQTAVWTLAASPEQALTMLQERLQPVKRTELQRIKQLIGQLDSEQPLARQMAAKELARLGIEAEPVLRQALEQKATSKARLRISTLLANIRQWRVGSSEDLRQVRAVQVLERIGSQESLSLLRELGQGAPGALLTREANAAGQRLIRQ